MNGWRDLERHPLSSEYCDLTGTEFKRFCLRMKRVGFIATFPIMLYDGKILDGWQRFRVCVETNTEPEFSTLPDHMDPEEYVQATNDDRRHETEIQRNDRILRVLARKQRGDSYRKIAKEEGISEAQARRDFEKAQSRCAPQGAPEIENGKVTGTDGKKYPATQPEPERCASCRRCIRVGQDLPKNCPECRVLRGLAPKAPKPVAPSLDETDHPVPPKDDKIVRDDDGEVVPQRLLQVFMAVPFFRRASIALSKASTAFSEMEACSAAMEAKPIESGAPFAKFRQPLKSAARRCRQLRPSLVCTSCKGDGADGCKCAGKGWKTVEEAARDN